MTLSPSDAKFVEELRKLHEEADPEEARKFTQSLPEINDRAGTLAISYGQLRGKGKPKPEEPEEADEPEETDED